jgi:hypothetical protein
MQVKYIRTNGKYICFWDSKVVNMCIPYEELINTKQLTMGCCILGQSHHKERWNLFKQSWQDVE